MITILDIEFTRLYCIHINLCFNSNYNFNLGSIVPKQIVNGDHVELLNANNVECIQIRQVNLYEEFKSVLDQLKTEKSKHF